MKTGQVMVSVVMAVYNGEAYLREAIQSVLNQTYTDFEFIIVNDASTDGTASIIKQFCDSRIRVINNQENMRLAASLNRGIKEAQGKYIVRMDADDICFEDRFQKQVDYMEKHPEIGVAFGSVIKFSDGKLLKEIDTNEKMPEFIRATMLFFNTVHHPNVIMRREIFDEFAYPTDYSVSEDMALWLQIMNKYKIIHLDDYTLLYRMHERQVSTKYHEKQRKQEIQMKKQYLEQLLGTLSEEDVDLHSRISYRREEVISEELKIWSKRLKDANEKSTLYERNVFEKVLIRICIIVAIYNRYLLEILRYLCKEFGFFQTIYMLFRIGMSLILESVKLQKAFLKGKKLL